MLKSVFMFTLKSKTKDTFIFSERNRWTDAEMEELRKYAKDYLEKRKTPNRATCRTYIQLSRNKGGVLQERTAENILKKISAMNVKARKNDK